MEDVMTLVDSPRFDFALLNYAAYVRVVSSSKVRTLFLALTSTLEYPPYVSKEPNHRTGEFPYQVFPRPVSNGNVFSALGPLTMQNTRCTLWIKTGGPGSSRFARSGATFSYVPALEVFGLGNKLTRNRLRHQTKNFLGSSLAYTHWKMSPRSVTKPSLLENIFRSRHYQTLLLSTRWAASRLQKIGLPS